MADRQISVRLGQSFWSRGPSLNSNFTAKDFPSLQPHPDGDSEDYASMLQASMELTQILHNAHAVLYSSKSRTMAMVLEGNYARYLDDFRTSGDYLAFDMERYCGICEHKDDFDDHVRVCLSVYQCVLVSGCLDTSLDATCHKQGPSQRAHLCRVVCWRYHVVSGWEVHI